MEKGKKLVAILFAVGAGFSVMVFWLIYLGLGGGFMPSITKIPLVGEFIYELPFGISGWWDIPMAGIIVYIFLSAKKRGINLVFYFIALLETAVLMAIFGNKIFIPLLLVELTFGLSIGIIILHEKDYPLITTKEILGILPKELLIATWTGLSIGAGLFYGFVIGAVLALVSTLSIAIFSLLVFFGKKDLQKLLSFLSAVSVMLSLTSLFISGYILANITLTLISGGSVVFFTLILWILKLCKKEKKI